MSQVTVTKNPVPSWMDRATLPSFSPPLASEMSSLNRIALVRRFADEMDRMFGPAPGHLRNETDFWMPSIEMTERDGHLTVSAELPGLRQDDVKVEITKDTLILQGERKRAHREKYEGYDLSERSYGRFYRAIPLPEGANIDKAMAELVNGTLEVSIPIPEAKTSRRQIPVQEGKPRTVSPN